MRNSFTSFLIIVLISNIYLLEARIIISNCQDLQNMNSTGTYMINQTIDCSRTVPFNPIPLFSGILSGNNNVIQNVLLYSSSSGVGIFKCLSGATIQDLVLLKFTVNATGTSFCVGSLSGKAINTIITNVHLKAPLSSPNIINGNSQTGGLLFFSLFLIIIYFFP